MLAALAIWGLSVYAYLPSAQFRTEIAEHRAKLEAFQSRLAYEDGLEAVQRLAGCGIFSFGGYGYVALRTEDEDLFYSIIATENAPQLFRRLYEIGTPQAKLYALAGLHVTRGEFEAYAARFVLEHDEVTTASSCVIRTGPAQPSLWMIRSGVIEGYVIGQATMDEDDCTLSNRCIPHDTIEPCKSHGSVWDPSNITTKCPCALPFIELDVTR